MASPHVKKRILVGDSEAWAVDLFRQAAERLDFELHHARNGVEVLELFKSLMPAVVVVDTLLPKLDGLKVTSKLRETELGRITPVIVTSALYRHGPEVERLRTSFGFTEFLEKPFRLADIEALLADHLREEGESPASDQDVSGDGELVRAPEAGEAPIGELGTAALLCRLQREQRTGVLTLRQGEITKTVCFQAGRITHARSNSKRDRLGRILLRTRRLTPEDYERARRLQVEQEGRILLGQALVQLGVLSENDVANAVSCQILNVLFSLFPWRDGTWSFLETASLPAEYARFSFNTSNVIFWGLRQLEGREDFARLLPSSRAVVRLAPGWERLKDTLNLTYFEEQVLGLADGRRRLGDILSLSRLSQVDVARVIFSCVVLGLLVADGDGHEDEAVRPVTEARPVESKGTLAHTSVARLFSRVRLARQSGTCAIHQPPQSAEVFFDRGEIVYARSNRDEFRLGSVLLRSGKLAISDYQRAIEMQGADPARRIGAILVELRALSLEELDWALRFQAQAVVLDLFTWREGDFTFTEGGPRLELTVNLDAATENLIMEGARGTPPPPGIVAALKSPGTLLQRAGSDEEVLRRLHLTSAERRLLAYIESGRTMREISSLRLLGTEEMARSLHGLLALELVKILPGSDSAVDRALAEDSSELSSPDGAWARAERPGAVKVDGHDTNSLHVSQVLAENEALRRENGDIRERLAVLEREVAALQTGLVRYYDMKEGKGAGIAALKRILGESVPLGSGTN